MTNRGVWIWPAVAGATVTALVVVGLRVVEQAPEAYALPRTPATSTTSESAAEPSSAPSSSPTWTSEDAKPRLHLQGHGLDVVGFGASQLNVVRTLTDDLGPPDEDRDLPCWGHREDHMHWVRWADLEVVFDKGRFMGYMEGVVFMPGSKPVELGTARGLSPGDSFDRAQDIYGELQVRHLPLPGPGKGDTFRFEDPAGQGPMFGVVECPDQTIVIIYAGVMC